MDSIDKAVRFMDDLTAQRALAEYLRSTCRESMQDPEVNRPEVALNHPEWWHVANEVEEAAAQLPDPASLGHEGQAAWDEKADVSAKLMLLTSAILCLSPHVVGLGATRGGLLSLLGLCTA